MSPVARRRAGELRIDPETLEGTGIDGSVSLADVELAASKGAPAKAPSPDPALGKRRAGFDPDQMRQAIAGRRCRNRSARSRIITCPAHRHDHVAWLDWRPTQGAWTRGAPAACRLCCSRRPRWHCATSRNSTVSGRKAASRQADGFHVGWAIALRGGGLIAPAIRDIDTLSLASLMEALRDLVGRARAGGIKGSEMMDPTFTVTSLGDRGAEFVRSASSIRRRSPFWALGGVIQRPWVVGWRDRRAAASDRLRSPPTIAPATAMPAASSCPRSTTICKEPDTL